MQEVVHDIQIHIVWIYELHQHNPTEHIYNVKLNTIPAHFQ